MTRAVKDLEAGSVYITISLPHPVDDDVEFRIRIRDRKPGPSGEIDIATYETHCTRDLAQEEFSWGLYFHRASRDGVRYSLKRQQGGSAGRRSALFRLDRQQVSSSPRLQCQVVGLVRVLRVPPILCEELTWYMDWLALQSHVTATRSFIWATSMYLRTWHHTVRMLNNPSLAYGTRFDVNLFLREALGFAYAHVDYAMGGQLPRPIIKSAFGTELGVLEEDSAAGKALQLRGGTHSHSQTWAQKASAWDAVA
ncbi:uncharacterized protein UV8b_00108 [Ustilaginoidea virens]|uniref:Uncharacterized protein n=1 Tax=Ustilaginoidea virens TaxID=1159556 RepID=A0A063BMK7_USTVR|nr:uncharacterized protein UV8b_00108 [Ustilaginoidea virens]QUC15867.1 hypothetical protein UV8b_00108 [Ustilaginoidea virens]GAO18995.1 hypothetical protein UVI_02060680 [Ustilaginoidea virens]